MNRRRGVRPAVGWAAALGGALALGVLAAPGPSSTPVASERSLPAVRAYKDPVTGRIGPPPPGAALEEGKATVRRAGRPAPVPEPLPGGGFRLRLLPRRTTATKGPDGRVSIECRPAAVDPGRER